MALVDTRGFNLQSNLTQDFGQGVRLGRNISQFGRKGQIRDLLSKAIEPPTDQQDQLAEQSAGLGQDSAIQNTQEDLIRQARQIDPVIAEQQLQALGLTDNLKRAEASRFASQLQNTPFEQRAAKIQARSAALQAEGRDSKDTIELIDMDEAQQNQALTGVQLLDLSTRERLAQQNQIARQKRGTPKSGSQREFEALIEDFSPEDQTEARRVKAGIEGRAVGSAAQTIAEEGTAKKVAQSSAVIKSTIKRAVVKAEAEAKERGEVLTDLSRSRAALPGLNKVVDQLRDLSKLATSTLGGQAWNTIVKQTGFGSTKGATARAKFIATVNNQVLPLLKPTFGAAFTVQEGETLKATLGDPNASPDEKMAQLDAFIAQKIRDIETKESQLQSSRESTKPISQMSDAEIQAELAGN